MFRLLSLFIRQFRYFGGLVKHAPSIVALEGVCLLLGSLLALWVRPRERRISIEVFYIVFESRLRHLRNCPFKASTPEQEEFLRDITSPSLFGRPKHKARFPKALPLRCVLSPSTSRMSGGDVQTDSPSTPSRFLDIANKENFHTKFSESAWRRRWEALDCRKRHASWYRRSADSQARYLRFP